MRGETRGVRFILQGIEYRIKVEDVTVSGGLTDWRWSVKGPGYERRSDGGRLNDSPATAFGLAVMQIVADARTGRNRRCEVPS